MASRRLLLIVVTVFTLAFPVAAADGVTVTEYVLPVSPLNLLVDPYGDIWFSSFQDNAIGKLDPGTGQIDLYTRQGSKNVWGLKRDAQGNLWFSTANGKAVGKFEPYMGKFLEWGVPCKPFGLEIDPVTGEIWFACQGVDEAWIYRFSPSTNQGTHWSVSPFTNATDVDLSPSGDVWFTVQPGYYQGVGRFDPVVEQIVIWTMPIPDSEPLRLIAEADTSIWFTESGTAANAIAQFLPLTNTLRMFQVSTPESNPWSLLITGSQIWFTERGGNSLGRLDPGLATPTTATLLPSLIPYDPVVDAILPSSYIITPQVSSASIFTSTVTQIEAGGFLELRLAAADSQPAGIAIDASQSTLWFAETAANRIGKLEIGAAVSPSLFLPLIVRGD